MTDRYLKIAAALMLACLAVMVALERCSGQENRIRMTFAPQPGEAPEGLYRYAVTVCSSADKPVDLSGGLVYEEAARVGIAGATRSTLQAYATQAQRPSIPRIIAWIIEGGSMVVTGMQATGRIRIRESDLQSIAPLTGGATRILTTAYPQRRGFTLPDDLVPPFIRLEATGCQQFSLFGTQGKGPAANGRLSRPAAVSAGTSQLPPRPLLAGLAAGYD